jgi:glycosyltransferase involved in cell wall biosynthesis
MSQPISPTHPERPTADRPSLVAVILTRNEADHISACIASLTGWTDAVVVWDSGSSDATAQLAYLAGALVIERPFDNYAAQRQAALDSLSADWVLFVDADERVPAALRDEILAVLTEQRRAEAGASSVQPVNGYWLARRNLIVGRRMQGGGFWPDYQLRLLRRAAARYLSEREVHEVVDVGGREAKLAEPLVHHNYRSWAQFFAKQRAYAAYEARILKSRGIRARPHNFVLQPLREFRRRFFTLRGYLDGAAGLRLALLLAWYYGFYPYWLLARGKV